jgi:hypothetical protein
MAINPYLLVILIVIAFAYAWRLNKLVDRWMLNGDLAARRTFCLVVFGHAVLILIGAGIAGR